MVETTLSFLLKDGETVQVNKDVMLKSNTVKGMVDDGTAVSDEAIPLPEINKATFDKVIEFCKYIHAGNAEPDIERPLRSNDLADHTTEWYTKFVEVERDMVEDILLAANFLDIKPLLELCCAKIATYIKGKSIQEVRQFYNIENDFILFSSGNTAFNNKL